MCITYNVESINILNANVMNSNIFKLIYGMTTLQTVITWKHIIGSLNVSGSFRKKHLLCTLRFLKHYQTKRCLAYDLRCAPCTLIKWVWFTIYCLAELKIVSSIIYVFINYIFYYYLLTSTHVMLISQKYYFIVFHAK